MEDNTDYKCKVEVEETTIDLGYVKKELKDEIFDFGEKTLIVKGQYRVVLNYESLFRKEIGRDKDNLIGFLGNDIIMEQVIVKLEDVKEENTNIDYFYCNKCGRSYDGYCSSCSTLVHIINNSILHIKSESDPELNTLPINILEIKNNSTEKRVFALKTIPKNVTFGPFEGVSAIETTDGLLWRIKDKKIVEVEKSNWMKYVGYAENDSLKNLDIFQSKNNLYFQSIREINEGEELLIGYNERDIQKIDNEEQYLLSVKEDLLSNIFACSLCCLGFALDKCLIEHKSKCPHAKCDGNIKDLKIVECHLCKIWLEKQEYLEHHLPYCVKIYHKVRDNVPKIQEVDIKEENAIHVTDEEAIIISDDENTDSTESTVPTSKTSVKLEFECSMCPYKGNSIEDLSQHKCKNPFLEIESVNDVGDNIKIYKCPICTYKTNFKQVLQRHVTIHSSVKAFQCDICEMRFFNKPGLQLHMKNKHLTWSKKDYKCHQCDYQTNLKHYLMKHMSAHRDDIVYKCDDCEKVFRCKNNLNLHIKDHHQKEGDSQLKCPRCTYQTNYEFKFLRHVDTHLDIKRFECRICKNKYNEKQNLELHMKMKHGIDGIINHKCTDCSYQTPNENDFQAHLKTHSDVKSLFHCYICKKAYSQKIHLELHIITHRKDKESHYKCPKCSYETQKENELVAHLNEHRDVKRFECKICKKAFDCKYHLEMHNKTRICSKEYKCEKCPYRTKYKHNLGIHRNTHYEIKRFQCHVCKKRYSQKQNLKIHIKTKHPTTRCSDQVKCSCLTDCRKTHSDVKVFQCDICKTKFNVKASLVMHIKIKHRKGEAIEYKCPICPYRTLYNYNLNLHQRHKHEGMKLLACNICKKTFKYKSTLQSHMAFKHGDEKATYICTQCPYETASQNNLKRHLNQHKGFKFECNVCKKAFRQRYVLKNHIESQHGADSLQEYLNTHVHKRIKQFKCNVCERVYNRKVILMKHLRTHHKN